MTMVSARVDDQQPYMEKNGKEMMWTGWSFIYQSTDLANTSLKGWHTLMNDTVSKQGTMTKDKACEICTGLCISQSLAVSFYFCLNSLKLDSKRLLSSQRLKKEKYYIQKLCMSPQLHMCKHSSYNRTTSGRLKTKVNWKIWSVQITVVLWRGTSMPHYGHCKRS